MWISEKLGGTETASPNRRPQITRLVRVGQAACEPLRMHHAASLRQTGPFHERGAGRLDGWFHTLPPAKPLYVHAVGSIFVIVFVLTAATLRDSSALADSIAIRRGEVSASARAQGEGIYTCGRMSGHSIPGERMRAAFVREFHARHQCFFLFYDSRFRFRARISTADQHLTRREVR
jgi:hypothetical protein